MVRARPLIPRHARRGPAPGLGPVLLAAVGLGACGGKEGNEPNILPSAPTSTGADASSAGDSVGPGDAPTTEGPTTTGGAEMFPATYRFECVDIQVLGDGDDEAIQTGLLENVWRSDIAANKLNILLTVVSRDDAAGTAELQVTSGVGPSTDQLCSPGDTQSMVVAAEYQAGVALWQDGVDPAARRCSKDGAGSDGLGTYSFTLGPQDIIYIYAEDDDGVSFNCDAAQVAPDAVPVHAVDATVTVGPGEQILYGSLLGCLTVVEATGLCSCIGVCVGDPHPDCGACPVGSRPLVTLLDGVNPSDRCTGIMGEPALDIQLALTAETIGYVPGACG